MSDYLARACGVRVTPDRIVIVAGIAQGFGLLAHVLRARGARILATEAFGHPGHREGLRRL